MIFNYFISFCKANKIKIAVLIFSISLYFALAVSLLALNNSLPEVVSLPFKKIGLIDADFVMGIPLSVTGKSIYFDR